MLAAESVTPELANAVIVPRGTEAIRQRVRLQSLLLRPQLSYADLEPLSELLVSTAEAFGDLRSEVIEQVEIGAKYDGYIEKERTVAEKLGRLEDIALEDHIEYGRLTSLSIEARQKLTQIRPRTLGQASRSTGVAPASLSVMMVYLGR